MAANGHAVLNYNYYTSKVPLLPTPKMCLGSSWAVNKNMKSKVLKFLATFAVVSAVASSSYSPCTNDMDSTSLSAVASHPDVGALVPWETSFDFDGLNIIQSF